MMLSVLRVQPLAYSERRTKDELRRSSHNRRVITAGGLMEKFISLSTGVRLEYVEQGPSDGIPVVFLHGVTDSWHSFEGVLRHLPPTVHSFAISQRGHGDSSRPESGYLLSDLSDDLAAFM